MSRPGRLTAVARLTLWYLALFTVATGAIVFGTYALVVREVESDPGPSLDLSSEVGARWSEALAVSDPGSLFEQAADDARQQVLEDLLHRSVAVFVVGVAMSSLGAWFLARRSLRPVGQIASLARGISGGNLHGRIALDGPDDELKELADTFDSMLERLELAFHTQRAFAAQVSHEPRTPLAVMRAEAELADPGSRERVLARAVLTQVDRADQVVSSLLALARADSGAALHDSVELGDLVGEVVGGALGRG